MLLGLCGSAARQYISVVPSYPQSSRSTAEAYPSDVTQTSNLFQIPAKTENIDIQDIILKEAGSMARVTHNPRAHETLIPYNIW